jgi:hypothetical protein
LKTDGKDVIEKARGSPVLRFFVLPPVDQRRMVNGIIKAKCYPLFSTEADDTYIYYLLLRLSFFIVAMFSFLLLASEAFKTQFTFYLFTVSVNPNDLAESAAWVYSRVVSTMLFVVCLPYGLLLFRANMDFNCFDLLHWNVRLSDEQKRGWPILWRMFVAVGAIFIPAYCSLDATAYVISEYDFAAHSMRGESPSLGTSYMFFTMTLAFYTWIYSFIPMIVVEGCSIGYQHLRRLGPRYPDIISSSKPLTNGDSQ